MVNGFTHAGECGKKMILCMHTRTTENGMLDLCVHLWGVKIEMCNAGIHLQTLRN